MRKGEKKDPREVGNALCGRARRDGVNNKWRRGGEVAHAIRPSEDCAKSFSDSVPLFATPLDPSAETPPTQPLRIWNNIGRTPTRRRYRDRV